MTQSQSGNPADDLERWAEGLQQQAERYNQLQDQLQATSVAMAEIVNGVRIAVRDILSAIAGDLISWTIELVCTVGVAAPVVIAQATEAIARVSMKVAKLVRTLLTVVDEAGKQLVALRDVLDGFIRALNALEQGRQTAPA